MEWAPPTTPALPKLPLCGCWRGEGLQVGGENPHSIRPPSGDRNAAASRASRATCRMPCGPFAGEEAGLGGDEGQVWVAAMAGRRRCRYRHRGRKGSRGREAGSGPAGPGVGGGDPVGVVAGGARASLMPKKAVDHQPPAGNLGNRGETGAAAGGSAGWAARQRREAFRIAGEEGRRRKRLPQEAGRLEGIAAIVAGAGQEQQRQVAIHPIPAAQAAAAPARFMSERRCGSGGGFDFAQGRATVESGHDEILTGRAAGLVRNAPVGAQPGEFSIAAPFSACSARRMERWQRVSSAQ